MSGELPLGNPGRPFPVFLYRLAVYWPCNHAAGPLSPYALSPFDLAALLVVASALLGMSTTSVLRLPHVIGLTVMGAALAIGLVVADALIPGVTLDNWVAGLLEQLNFTETLLQGMLSFLLFAGALHVDLVPLKRNWLPVLLLSTVGVIISTLLVGASHVGRRGPDRMTIAPIWYFVFGALISPDRSGVGARGAEARKRPEGLQAAVAGESLFNDGVGIVVFAILLDAAVTGTDFSLASRREAVRLRGGRRCAARPAIRLDSASGRSPAWTNMRWKC